MTERNDTMGRTGFVAEYQLWSDQDLTEAERVVRLIEENRLEVIRLSYPDQHGILRGKTIMASEAQQAMRSAQVWCELGKVRRRTIIVAVLVV